MVGRGEIDVGRRGGRLWVVSLLMDLCLFFLLPPIAPLTIELDGFVLPDLEGGWDWVHRVDTLFDSLYESLLEHLAKSDVVMTTQLLILFEILNVLFSCIGGHSDVLEFCSSGRGGIGVTEAGLELMNKVEEREEWRSGDVGGIGYLGISRELSIPIFRSFTSFDRLNCLVSPFGCVAFAQEG